ncbi:hypothetical protein [Romboutsia lituseburensis]|uniref:hypothetical protein n=1 Tax=Romboutsia lituseburensis TaxID=1537 RepID=UPI0022EB8497|nr:hypothetical protein [Romboutsia lituseburensis]
MKNKNKVFTFSLVLSIILIFGILIYLKTATGEKYNIDAEKESIKEVLETFIKDDYNYNGGKNDFSTVGNENLKKYLIARNAVKYTNHKSSYKKVLSQKFEFDYKDFSKWRDCVKVNVYMDENYSFEDEDTGQINKDAGAGNDYIVYLSKVDGEWKVMSATIDVDVDPVDDVFDVNKELGYGWKKTRERVDEDLNKMLDKLNDLKEQYSEPIN